MPIDCCAPGIWGIPGVALLLVYLDSRNANKDQGARHKLYLICFRYELLNLFRPLRP